MTKTKHSLTEKKMANKKFRVKERAIFIAYFKLKDYPSAKAISRMANISRPTFYRHHQNAASIPKDYEDYMVSVFARKIRKYLSRKNVDSRFVFFRTLVFISSNKEVFKALFKNDHKEVAKRMLEILKPKITEKWRLSNGLDKLYNIYKNEILGIIEIWCQQNFSDCHLNAVLEDIMYLTKTARTKLLPLTKNL